MYITIIAKTDLDQSRLERIDRRINADSHRHESGPIRVWHAYAQGLYAAVDLHGQVVALLEASGPRCAVNPGWWVDPQFRCQGVGRRVVAAFAAHLKKAGYSGIGEIQIQTYGGAHDEASRRLRETFVERFHNS